MRDCRNLHKVASRITLYSVNLLFYVFVSYNVYSTGRTVHSCEQTSRWVVFVKYADRHMNILLRFADNLNQLTFLSEMH